MNKKFGQGLSQSGFLEKIVGLANFKRFLINVLGCMPP